MAADYAVQGVINADLGRTCASSHPIVRSAMGCLRMGTRNVLASCVVAVLKWRVDGGWLAVSSFFEYEKWKRRTMHEAGAKSQSSS